MPLRAYCINLDRSVDRWQSLSEQARLCGIDVVRVAGVDGTAIPPGERTDLNAVLFRRYNGRAMLPGEYGCYRSHLKALETIVADGAAAALIIEDDVLLQAGLADRAAAIVETLPTAGLVKLLNHRSRGFRRTAVTSLGDEIGRCLHGPQGSAACYLVTRQGAIDLLAKIRTMSLPYDIAIERGWETGVATFTTSRNIIELGPMKQKTEIGTIADYGVVKMRGLARMPTHLFRARDYLRRVIYAAQA